LAKLPNQRAPAVANTTTKVVSIDIAEPSFPIITDRLRDSLKRSMDYGGLRVKNKGVKNYSGLKINQNPNSSDVVDYIVSVLKNGQRRKDCAGDEILSSLEFQIPEIGNVKDILIFKNTASASYFDNEAERSNELFQLLVDISGQDETKLAKLLRSAVLSISQNSISQQDARLRVDGASPTALVGSQKSDVPRSQSALAIKLATPQAAPAHWKTDKLDGETPPAFIKRVYGEWLGKGLDRPTVRRLDPALSQALDNWLRKNDMPPDVDLPTVRERNAREIAALKGSTNDSSIHKVLGDFTAREAERIRSNIRRHENKQK
jgi:hypothetical protein